jgi:hypothetical protein
MTDFLSEAIADNGVVERDVTFRGKTGPVHFRRISAGERAQLTRGQKIVRAPDGGNAVEIDIGESVTAQHMLVQFSVCNPDGTRRFKALRDVQALDGGLVSALYAKASEVNGEDDAGKP